MAYTYDIEYVKTKQFGNADGLSRLPSGPNLRFDNATVDTVGMVQDEFLKKLPVSSSLIAEETSKNVTLSMVKQFVLQGWPLKYGDEQLNP